MMQEALFNPLDLGKLLSQLSSTKDQSLLNNITVNI